MYYEAIPSKQPRALFGPLFVIVRAGKPEAPNGPYYAQNDAERLVAAMNASLAYKIAMAMTMGRHHYAQALADPHAPDPGLEWLRSAEGLIAMLDGSFLAKIEQAYADGMFELTLWKGTNERVGAPVLCFSQEDAKAKVLQVYAMRGA